MSTIRRQLSLGARRAGLLLAAGGTRVSSGGSADRRGQPLASPSRGCGVQPVSQADRADSEHLLRDSTQGSGAGAAQQSADGPRAPLRAAGGLVAGTFANGALAAQTSPLAGAARGSNHESASAAKTAEYPLGCDDRRWQRRQCAGATAGYGGGRGFGTPLDRRVRSCRPGDPVQDAAVRL